MMAVHEPEHKIDQCNDHAFVHRQLSDLQRGADKRDTVLFGDVTNQENPGVVVDIRDLKAALKTISSQLKTITRLLVAGCVLWTIHLIETSPESVIQLLKSYVGH